jgi:hypothetical protein
VGIVVAFSTVFDWFGDPTATIDWGHILATCVLTLFPLVMTGLNGHELDPNEYPTPFAIGGRQVLQAFIAAILPATRGFLSSTDPVNFGIICKSSLCLLMSLITNDSTAIDHRSFSKADLKRDELKDDWRWQMLDVILHSLCRMVR